MDRKNDGSDHLGEIQRKTFTRWINEKFQKASLPLSIRDLYKDFRDGKLLLSLLQTLTGQRLITSQGQDSAGLDLISQLLCVLEKFNVKSDEISAGDIHSGDRKTVHSLIWTIILRWHIEAILKNIQEPDAKSNDWEAQLLAWCRRSTQGYRNVEIHDFTTSWRDGLAFNAIIHKHCPDLFSYDQLLTKDNVYRLDHAFTVANKKLLLPALLDADDVDINYPEKRSIMIYLVYVYDALSRDKLDLMNDAGTSDKHFRYSVPLFPASSETSLYRSGVSLDFGGFMGAVSETLAWLLEACNALSSQPPVAQDTDELKEQFHHHEKFMMQLTQRQNSIGNVLQEGNHLLVEGRLTTEEESQVEHEMALLNNRWEELRLQAMDRQTRLQQSLMGKQQQQLDSLSDWLTSVEVRISACKANSSSSSNSERSVHQQIKEQKLLQAEVEQQQQRVSNLQSMVVVVDETNSEAAYAALEQQLESLGTRWTSVCRWVEEYGLMLQEALARWQGFNERLKEFTDWLTETENTLAGMRTINVSDINQVVEHVQCLKSIENDMDEMMKCFDELNDFGLELVQYIGNDEAGIQSINAKLQECQERWDSLVQLMEQNGKEIVHSGIELTISKTSSGSQMVTVSRKGEKPVTVSLSSGLPTSRPGSAKRPRMESGRKKEFDRQVAALSQWLDQTEVTQELITIEPENIQDRLTIEEQLVLIEDAEKDVKAHEKDMEQMRNLGKALWDELRTGKDSTDSVDEVMQRLESRWKRLNELLLDNMSKVNLSSKSKQVYSELSALQEVVENYEKWVLSEGPAADEFMELSRQLEHCRVKLKAFLSHDNQMQKINSCAKELVLSSDLSAKILEKDLKELNSRWIDTHRKLSERQILLTKAFQKTPPKSFMDSFSSLVRWLDVIKGRFESTSCDVNATEVMEQHIATCRDIQLEMRDRSANLEYINQTGQDLMVKAPTDDKSLKLRNDLQKLNSKWSQVQLTGTAKIATLESRLEQLKQYKSQTSEVICWVEEMELFLTSEEAAIGDITALQAQLQESDGALEDMKTMKNILDTINCTAEKLRPEADETFLLQFDSDLEMLNERWKNLVSLSQKHNAKLRENLDVTQKLLDDIELQEKWIDKIVKDHLAREYTVHSELELAELNKKFQDLDEEMKSLKQFTMKQLEQRVTNIVAVASRGSAQDLNENFAKLNDKWTDMCQAIEKNRQKFMSAEADVATFGGLISEETIWINDLEEKLLKGSKLSGDAEELSEELEDMESFLATRKEENLGRINELAQVLLNNHIMVAMITTDRDGYMERQKRIMDEAKQRTVCLTEAVLTAQNREGQIVEVSQWMTDVTALLQARLDADILAGDTPKEFESLKAEFELHEAILADFDKEVAVFREENRMEEAERLEQQLLILKKHYAEVSAKFCKFQRPVDFDPKHAHIKHVLEELEEQIHILDISSLEPEHLQTQLDHCMKFYKTMSEIKPEVEYVIKTGRQVVEKKQVDSPEKLNADLDNTKQLYNELGAQVTQSKSILDQTLKLMRKLKTESTALNDFIASTNEELNQKGSNKYTKDIEDELIWIKATQVEVSKMQPHLTTLSDVIGQLHKIVDESILTKLDDRVKELTSQMNDLTSRIAQRKKALQELSEELEKAYVEFETTQRELMIWMDNTEDFLNELDAASSIDESLVEQIQQIVLEHSQLISQLDQVRDSAVDIISRSNRYSKTVEPLLTLLNQRWQEITDRLKDKQNLQIEASVKQKKVRNNENAVPTIILSTDEETDFGSSLAQLLHELEEYHLNLVEDKGNLQNLSGSQADDKLIELRENEEMLRTRIEEVLNDETFVTPSSTASDSDADDAIQKEDLQVTWKKVLNESERQRLAIILNMADFTEFRLAAEEMDHWLNGIEQKLVEAAGNEDQIKNLDEELMKKKSAFDNLTKKMNQLHSPHARMKAFELLNLLNCHFSCLLRQVSLYLKTANFSSHVSLRRLSVRKIVFVSETSQYIRDLQSLTGMLCDLELELKTPIIPDCQPDLTTPQEDEFKTIEDALDAIQCSMESAENSKEEALSMASEEERSRVDETLRDLRARLFSLQKETADRKRSEEDLVLSVDRFTSQLDDITSWLNETENILNDRISAADRDQMWKLLDIVKERERHLHKKQRLLRSLSQNGRPIFYHPDIAPSAKERIMRDLSSAIDRWNKVVFMLPKKRHTLEERLHSLDLFYDELEKLSLLIPAAKIQLDTLQHALATSHRTSDKDVKVIRDVLEVGQCDVDRLKHLYNKLQGDVKESEAGVPDLVKQKMDDILADWTILHGQAVILQNTVIKQEPEKRAVPVEENIRQFESSLMQSENLSFPLPDEVLSGPSELDEKVASLDRAIQGAVQDVLLYKVEIGNIRDIETTIRNGKVKIAEIETYKQDLDESSELLKSEMKNDEDRLHMEETVERLRKRSEETKTNLTRRNAKLEDMLLECRQFEQMNIEFERWIISLEEEYMAQHDTVGHTITALEELIEANKRLQLEASPWQSRVDSLHSMADKLVEEYQSDDGTNLKALLDRTDERWNSLLTRLTNQAKLLQNTLNSIYRFDADLKDFFLWLTKVEIVLKHHDELMANDNTTSDEVQSKQVHQAFKDLQCEINEHQDTLESLNSTGNQIIVGLQTGKAESLQNQLDDMNQRWNRLKLKSGELRNRLDVQVNGNSDSQALQQILELTNWLTQLDNDLGVLDCRGGETSALQHQKDRTKEIRSQLEAKRFQVEQLLKLKRQTETSDENKTTTADEITQNWNSEEELKLLSKNAFNEPIDLLNQKWTEVNRKSEECGVQISQTSEKMEVFEASINDATQFLMLKELVISRWPSVAEVPVDSLPGELSQTKSFHMDLISNQPKLEACKAAASDLLKDKNFVLSLTNKSRLENVQDRWQTLETAIEERLQHVITAMKECGSGTQYHLSMAVFPPWERSMAEAKVPYYINHSTETTQWDHPEMTRILSSLAELNTVKFSAYRTSMKLRLLQKRLSLDLVSMDKALEAFERSGLCESMLTHVTVTEIIQCLTSIYSSLPPTQGTSADINVSLCIDLVLNWLLNMYDSSRTGQIQSLSFRVAILVMCSANLDEKYKALFNTVANADGCVTQQELGLLLHACIQIPKQLGEIAAFGGSNIEPSVRSCFEKFGNPSEIKVSHFLNWMKLEPQSMVWLPVLHRLAAAESAKHQAKCNVCKDCPILGLRYRCLKCFSFDMCQNCFFSGRKAKSHKLTHPMQEYCSTTTSSEDMRDFTKMFKNKFRSKQYFKKHPRLGYLPVQSLGDTDTLERNPVTTVEFMSQTTNTSSPSKVVLANSRSSTPSTGSLNSQNQDRHSAKKQPALSSSPAQSSSQNNSISTLELHSRLEIYASRLAEVEQRRRETTPDWDDEHNLISQYCQSLHGNSTPHTLQSPMQIMMAMDAEQRAELEAMIRDLEEENKLLQAEYDQLKEAHREEIVKSPYDNVADLKANSDTDGHDAEMIAEARLLRQHKGRLEARMQILEDHNRQLDSQLRRLRQLLAEQPESEMRIVTYPFSQSPASASGMTSAQSSLPQRGPPSFASSMRQNGHNLADERGHSRSLNGNTEGHLETQTGNDQALDSVPGSGLSSEHSRGKNNIDNLFQVAEEVGRAVETLVNIMTDDERHAEEEKDLVTRQQQQQQQQRKS